MDGADCAAWFTPVIAIRSRTVRKFYKAKPGGAIPEKFPTPKMMMDNAWSYDEEEVKTELLTVDSDGEMAVPHCQCGRDFWSKVVVCEWPAEQDHERLAKVVEELKKNIQRADQLARDREAQQDAQPAK